MFLAVLLVSVCTDLMYCRAGVAAGLIVLCPCCCSTFIYSNPYKRTHDLINVYYLLVVFLSSLGVLTSNILLKYNTKKKKSEKKKILINSAVSKTLENCSVWKENWWRGLDDTPMSKKRPPPPACLDD